MSYNPQSRKESDMTERLTHTYTHIWQSRSGDTIMESRLVDRDCCCSVAKLYLTLCDPMDCSSPCFPVLHHILKFAQTHVH